MFKQFASALLALSLGIAALPAAAQYTLRVPIPTLQVAPTPVVPVPDPTPLTYLAAVSSEYLAFGSVGIAGTATQAVELLNEGTGVLELSPPEVAGTGFSSSTDCGATLAPASSCVVNVTFSPTSVAEFSGTLQLSSNASTPLFTIGLSGSGSLADPHFQNVSLLMHMDNVGSSTFTDVKGTVFTVTGNPTQVGSSARLGTGGFYNGPGEANSLVRSSTSNALAFGTGDFTVEFFAKFENTGYHQFAVSSYKVAAVPTSFYISRHYSYGQVAFGGGTVSGLSPTRIAPFGQWMHIAVSRVSGTTRLFLDGQFEASFADSNNYSNTGVQIGGLEDATGRHVGGSLDEIRVTKGVGRYTSNFTVPTAAYPNN